MKSRLIPGESVLSQKVPLENQALFEKRNYDQRRGILLPDEVGLTQESIPCNDPIRGPAWGGLSAESAAMRRFTEGSCTIILHRRSMRLLQNPGWIARETGNVWRQKGRFLGVLPFFKPAPILEERCVTWRRRQPRRN